MAFIRGTTSNDSLFGGLGDDTILGWSGSDIIYAGDGADLVFGGSEQDDLNGDAGNDTMVGAGGGDAMDGGDGDDLMFGDDGGDGVDGGAGNDTLSDGDGTDILTGGAGSDLFLMANDGDLDQIIDFEDGTDLIDVSEWGVQSFDDLIIAPGSTGTVVISYGGETLVVGSAGAPTTVSDLDDTDFVFAPATTIIDFEALDAPGFAAPVGLIDPNYANMAWSSAFAFAELDAVPFTNGAQNTTAGGTNVAINADGQPMNFCATNGDYFDLISLDTGAVFHEQGTVQIAGFSNGNVVALAHVEVGNTGASDVDFTTYNTIFGSFVQLDKLGFSYNGGASSAGDIAPPMPGVSEHMFYVDDIELLIY